MRAVAVSVRQSALSVAGLLVFGASSGAQVAIQVKSGTIWTSNIELKVVAPLTFRWRWDGAETPTGTAWQLATVTPKSTAGTRATDVIAMERAIPLPPKAGVYQDFVVTPASTWPATFYVRVRVYIGQKSVYSRWVTVSVVPSADVPPSPKCSVYGVKSKELKVLLFGDGTVTTQPITQSEVILYSQFRSVGVGIVFRNTLKTTVRYRQEIAVYRSDQVYPAVLEGTGFNPQEVRMLAGGRADTVKIPLVPRPPGATVAPDGRWRFWARATPLNGIASKCELRFDYVILQ